MTAPTLLDHVLVGLLAAVLAYAVLRGQPRAKCDVTFDAAAKIATYWANGLLLWLGAVATGAVWLVAGRPAAALGLAWPAGPWTIAAAITAGFVAWYVAETWWQLGSARRRRATAARWHRDTPFMPATRREFAHFAFLAVSAGVCEEIIFRGYLISYVGWFTGPDASGRGTAVVLPAVAFGVAHLYQGWTSVARIVAMAAAMGAIFVLTGSLLVPIVLHVLVDLAGGRLGLDLMADAASDATPVDQG